MDIYQFIIFHNKNHNLWNYKKKDSGKIFEFYCYFYFLQKFECWLWADIPESIRKKYNFPKTDIGIDIFVENPPTAIQCKYRNSRFKASDVHHFERIINAFDLKMQGIFMSNCTYNPAEYYQKMGINIKYDITFLNPSNTIFTREMVPNLEEIIKKRFKK